MSNQLNLNYTGRELKPDIRAMASDVGQLPGCAEERIWTTAVGSTTQATVGYGQVSWRPMLDGWGQTASPAAGTRA